MDATLVVLSPIAWVVATVVAPEQSKVCPAKTFIPKSVTKVQPPRYYSCSREQPSATRYVYIYIDVYIWMYMYVCGMCIYVCICMYVYICLYLYVCIYAYVYTYTEC